MAIGLDTRGGLLQVELQVENKSALQAVNNLYTIHIEITLLMSDFKFKKEYHFKSCDKHKLMFGTPN